MSNQSPPPPAPGTLSPDGNYRWDGSQWQAVQAPPPPGPTVPQPPVGTAAPLVPPPGEVKKKGHLARNLVIGVVGLFLLLIIIGVAAGGSKSTPSPQSNSTPGVSVASYAAVISPLSSKLGNDLTAAGAPCSGGDDQACITAEQAALVDAEAYKKAVDTSPVPSCLKDANNSYRDGITLLISGLTKSIDGLKTTNLDEVNAGTSDVTSGNEKIVQANQAVGSAKC